MPCDGLRAALKATDHFLGRARKSLVAWLSWPAILRRNTQESLRGGRNREHGLVICPKFSPTDRHTSKRGPSARAWMRTKCATLGWAERHMVWSSEQGRGSVYLKNPNP